MSKITEALSKLDPNNDNHWTSDGLPRIDTVKMLAGNPALTREMITAEVPNFSRQTALVAATQAKAGITNTPAAIEPTTSPATPPATEDVVVQATVETALDNVVKDYDALIEAAQAELQTAIIARDEAHALVQVKQDALDELINERYTSGAAEHPMSAISGYLQSQQGVLQERARRHAVLVESGVTLQDIQGLIPQKAPLDVALSSKKK